MVSGAGDAERKLGRYHLVEPIGGGPTGETFRAKVYGVAGFERQFAVKRFHRELVKNKQAADGIARAARVYGNLEHPRIARMQEFGVAGGETFAATELVEGIDVIRLIGATHGSGEPLALPVTMALMLQVARAVGYAHGRGIVHLGVCPTNIVCCPDGELKVTDFGFLPPRLPRKPADDFTLLARLPYLAPEQLLQEETGAATDVFQLGVVLYELLAGDKPFRGPTPLDLSQSLLSANPPPAPAPAAVKRVLSRALARSPLERFPDASALADAIEAAMREDALTAGPRELAATTRRALESLKRVEGQPISGAFAFPMPAPPSKQEAPTPLARALERGAAPSDGPLAVDVAARRTVLGMPAPAGVVPSLETPAPVASAVPRPNRIAASPPPLMRTTLAQVPRPVSPRGRAKLAPRHVDDETPTRVRNQQPDGFDEGGATNVVDAPTNVRVAPGGPAPASGTELGIAATLAMPAQPPARGRDDDLDLDDFPPTPLPPSFPSLDETRPPRDVASRFDLSSPPDPVDARSDLARPPHAKGHESDDRRPPAADLPFADLPVAKAAVGRRARRKAVILAGSVAVLAGGLSVVVVAQLLRGGGERLPRPPVHGKLTTPSPSPSPPSPSPSPPSPSPPSPSPSPSPSPLPLPSPRGAAAPADAMADPLAAAAALAGERPAAAVAATAAGPDAPAPTAPAPTAPALPVPEPLVIRSVPKGARVYLDGANVGKTPYTLDNTEDSHRLAVILPGHALHTADIVGGGEIDVTLDEVTPPNGRAGIKVRCREKNRYYVILDGKDTGQLCPTERLGVELGAHEVEIYDPVTDSRTSYPTTVEETRLSKRVRID